MNEFETFWDNIDQRLKDTKATTGLVKIIRGSMAKKPALKGLQATTWVQFPEDPVINIGSNRIPLHPQLSVFVTGKSNTNVHKTHLDALKLAFLVALQLHAWKPLPGDDLNSGCILKLDTDQSFQVVETNPQAYTIAVVFNANLQVTID